MCAPASGRQHGRDGAWLGILRRAEHDAGGRRATQREREWCGSPELTPPAVSTPGLASPRMKLIHTEILFSRGPFADSPDWGRINGEICDAITKVVWPPGAADFTIHPVRKINGVTPIKTACMDWLQDRHGWILEARYKIGTGTGTGPIDALRKVAVKPLGDAFFACEWETGNVSSSHRSLNKLCLGMTEGRLAGGAIILPTRKMYNYLTDRIGNYEELSPYLDFWRNAVSAPGVLAMYVVEHDQEDMAVPPIAKGTDGRALR